MATTTAPSSSFFIIMISLSCCWFFLDAIFYHLFLLRTIITIFMNVKYILFVSEICSIREKDATHYSITIVLLMCTHVYDVQYTRFLFCRICMHWIPKCTMYIWIRLVKRSRLLKYIRPIRSWLQTGLISLVHRLEQMFGNQILSNRLIPSLILLDNIFKCVAALIWIFQFYMLYMFMWWNGELRWVWFLKFTSIWWVSDPSCMFQL